jgi:hypothetical protein
MSTETKLALRSPWELPFLLPVHARTDKLQ